MFIVTGVILQEQVARILATGARVSIKIDDTVDVIWTWRSEGLVISHICNKAAQVLHNIERSHNVHEIIKRALPAEPSAMPVNAIMTEPRKE